MKYTENPVVISPSLKIPGAGFMTKPMTALQSRVKDERVELFSNLQKSETRMPDNRATLPPSSPNTGLPDRDMIDLFVGKKGFR